MVLRDVQLEVDWTPLPADIKQFLLDADERVERYCENAADAYRGFIPSDYVAVYHALQAIMERQMPQGNVFCEWGSGIGVVACLASMLGFQSIGIEVADDLVEASTELAEDYDLDVEFFLGSFLPKDADVMIDQAFTENDGQLSLDSTAPEAYSDIGLEIEDFDLVFCYPWPHDEPLMARLFDRFAARGALLLTYNETELVRLRRKI